MFARALVLLWPTCILGDLTQQNIPKFTDDYVNTFEADQGGKNGDRTEHTYGAGVDKIYHGPVSRKTYWPEAELGCPNRQVTGQTYGVGQLCENQKQNKLDPDQDMSIGWLKNRGNRLGLDDHTHDEMLVKKNQDKQEENYGLGPKQMRRPVTLQTYGTSSMNINESPPVQHTLFSWPKSNWPRVGKTHWPGSGPQYWQQVGQTYRPVSGYTWPGLWLFYKPESETNGLGSGQTYPGNILAPPPARIRTDGTKIGQTYVPSSTLEYRPVPEQTNGLGSEQTYTPRVGQTYGPQHWQQAGNLYRSESGYTYPINTPLPAQYPLFYWPWPDRQRVGQTDGPGLWLVYKPELVLVRRPGSGMTYPKNIDTPQPANQPLFSRPRSDRPRDGQTYGPGSGLTYPRNIDMPPPENQPLFSRPRSDKPRDGQTYGPGSGLMYKPGSPQINGLGSDQTNRPAKGKENRSSSEPTYGIYKDIYRQEPELEHFYEPQVRQSYDPSSRPFHTPKSVVTNRPISEQTSRPKRVNKTQTNYEPDSEMMYKPKSVKTHGSHEDTYMDQKQDNQIDLVQNPYIGKKQKKSLGEFDAIPEQNISQEWKKPKGHGKDSRMRQDLDNIFSLTQDEHQTIDEEKDSMLPVEDIQIRVSQKQNERMDQDTIMDQMQGEHEKFGLAQSQAMPKWRKYFAPRLG